MAVTPTNLRVTDTKRTTVDLAWDAAAGATGYKVYRDAVLAATLGVVLAWQDTGRTAATTYSYTITSTDAVPSESAQSAAVPATTDSASLTGVGSVALQKEMNRLANGGTYRATGTEVGIALAANQWAGSSNLAFQGALNVKAGNTGGNMKSAQHCLNQIAGSLDQMYGIDEAARRCV